MTKKFVRYSPEVEQEEPDFDKTLQTVLDDMKQHMRSSIKTEGIGRMVRNAHAKGYGLARAARARCLPSSGLGRNSVPSCVSPQARELGGRRG